MPLSAKKLGITQKELNALKRVRDGLREGRYRHVKNCDLRDAKSDGRPIFNMEGSAWNASCGTVGCIGGWMAMSMGMSTLAASDYVHDTSPAALHPLFFPHGVDLFHWDRITPKRAARAIDNFIETGDPKWAQVVPAGRS